MIVPLAERSTTGCGAGCRLAASAGINEAARKPLNAAAISGRMTDTMRSPVSRSRYSSLICQPSIVLLSRRFMSALGQKQTLTGVRPCWWTGSGGGFDRLLGVVVLILHRAHVAERGVESTRVVDLIDEAWKVSCNVI